MDSLKLIKMNILKFLSKRPLEVNVLIIGIIGCIFYPFQIKSIIKDGSTMLISIVPLVIFLAVAIISIALLIRDFKKIINENEKNTKRN